ncbi:MAG: ABC transporter permease [Clostridiales bacterium]|nr:ABC transporter permease [Clostridiales bacterium]
MKTILFAGRNTKEILRDPISFFFGLGFPLILLLLFNIINSAIPAEAQNTMFEIESIGPGVAVFGTIFLALFSGMLISKDRTTSFLMRLFASPMQSFDFIFGYTLPMIVMAAVQALFTFIVAAVLGLPLTINTALAILVLLPIAILFTGIGLLCGSILNEKAVGGICGALLTNVAAWLSGAWIPLDLIGGAFKKTAEVLPFYHAVQATKAAVLGNFSGIMPHLSIVLIYTVVFYMLAVIVFRGKMKSDKV